MIVIYLLSKAVNNETKCNHETAQRQYFKNVSKTSSKHVITFHYLFLNKKAAL